MLKHRQESCVIHCQAMRALVIAILLSPFVASAAAQSQNTSPTQEPPRSSEAKDKSAASAQGGTFKSDLGFSYRYLNDWDDLTHTKFFEALQRMEALAKNGKGNSKRDLATRASECRRMVLMLARPRPVGGSIVVTAIPFACFGGRPSEKDLPVLQSLAPHYTTAVMDVTSVRAGNYMLGSHKVWIERVWGTPKGQPKKPTIAEVVCGLLKKAFVCWAAGVGSNEAELKGFEQGAVTLDEDSAPALVPEAVAAQLKAGAKSPPATPANQSNAAPSAGGAPFIERRSRVRLC
jgi:hypothetical protein